MPLPNGFEFANKFTLAGVPAHVRVVVTKDIDSTESLFDAYSVGLDFPEYFGRNWNAFIDCLSDLSWIDEDVVGVVHKSLPSLALADLQLYLTCLGDVLARARISDRPQLRLFFDESLRQATEQALTGHAS